MDDSKALQELMQKRNEEIIQSDKKCCEINKEILDIEKKLMALLPDEAKAMFLKIDRLNMELICQIYAIIPPIILR